MIVIVELDPSVTPYQTSTLLLISDRVARDHVTPPPVTDAREPDEVALIITSMRPLTGEAGNVADSVPAPRLAVVIRPTRACSLCADE